jgi:hypothetical protein
MEPGIDPDSEPGVVHLPGQHDAEDQPGDDDAQQRVQVQHPPPAAIPAGAEYQADRDGQHQQVALDGEVADQPASSGWRA